MPDACKIPITVGVVGHLDAITTEDHKIQIENLFKDLASGYPNSPIYLFSSIAEGADRFVANILLDLRKREEFSKRFELIVPTPFEPEEYKNDFDDNSDKEFDSLVKQAKRSFCICPEGKKIDRPQQYLKTGKFVADSSLILIALWDGEEGKKGGTADIVNYKRTGDDDNVAESTFEYDGTVFVLPCARSGSNDKDLKKQKEEVVLSLELVLRDASIRETLEKIEEINADSLKAAQYDFDKSQSYLFYDPEKPEASQKSILSWYSIFDVLSVRFQKRDMRTAVWLFVIGLFLVITLEVYTNIWLNNIALGVAMLLIVFAILVYFNSRLKKNHKKYLYNRTLAEALRIQFYWNFAGINKNVSDYILRIHRKEFTWIKHILSSVYGVTYKKSSINSSVISDLTKNWVKNQADFFESSIKKMNRKLGRYHLVSNISFIISFALLISIFFLEKFFEENSLLNWVIVVIGSLLGLFAMIKAFIKMKGYDQLLNQYELMNVIYQRAEAKIIEINATIQDTIEQHSYLKALFFIIGKEALIENGNWYLIFKEKEPEIEGI
jgi:Flp pilus assembly protein TadB